VLGTLLKRDKSDWRSLAKSSQTCTSLRCTGLSGVHRAVSGAQAGSPVEQAALGKNLAHRGYNSPDCPVCTGLSGEPVAPTPTVNNAISGRCVDFANSHQGALDCPVCHRTVRCATSVAAATIGFARKVRKSCTVHCPMVHRTIWCAHGRKATMAF
jgi:hypothetical protein